MGWMISPGPRSAWFSIRRTNWLSDSDALQYVRTRVFIEEQAIPSELEWDREDFHASHLLAVDSASRPIGMARLVDSGQLGRMAVLPAWRGRGVGSALLKQIVDMARESSSTIPFLNAQVSVLQFYRRAGFEIAGDEFLEAGIPHRRMILHV